jgi:hypothetical protein
MTWALSLFGLGGVIGLGDWRRGMLFLLVVGFLQDPIRKIVPGFPVHLQMLVVGFTGIIILCAVLQNARLRLSNVYGRDLALGQAWTLFILLVLLQCAHTFLRYGNPYLAGLGIINYLTPLTLVLVGVTFARDETWIKRFIWAYLLLAVPVALTVYLSFYFQDDWTVLKSVGRLTGRPLLIYDQGGVLFSSSGLLRTGEIAAWHAGTAAMLLVILGTLDKRFTFRLVVGILVALLIGAVILTGRRKMLVAMAVFVAAFLFILMLYWRGPSRVGAIAAVLSAGAAAYAWLQPEAGPAAMYEARGVSVFGDALGRLSVAWDLAQSGFRRGGILGLGAGVSAQGAQYFGGGVRIVGGAAEAGGGKLLVELGLVGLLVVVYLLWRMVQHFHRLFRVVSASDERATVLMAGLSALLIANGVTFLAATQVFGDAFILILMGLFLSFLFALGMQIGRQGQASVRAL